MPGPGDLPADEFSAVLDSPETDFPLFAPPAEPVSDTRTPLALPGLLWQGITQPPDAANRECLARLGLDRPTTFAECAYRALVSAALARSPAG